MPEAIQTVLGSAVPAMKRFGVADADLDVMFRDNPRRLLVPDA